MKNTSRKKSRPAIVAAALVFMVAAAITFTACGEKTAPTGDGAVPGTNDVLKVGSVLISQEQMDEYTKLMLNIYTLSQGMDYATLVDDTTLEKSKAGVLDMMAQTEALRAHFAGKNVIPDNLDQEISNFKTQIFSSYPDVEERFKTLGITDNSIRYYLESNYLHEACQNEATDNGALPPDAEVEAFYNENPDQFFTDEQRRSSQVLFADEEHKPETKALAEDVRSKILSGEAVFEDMAAQHNTDSTKDTGGDLDFAGRGAFVEEFENALFALENIGDISEVVETRYGYHIIKLTDIQDANVQPFEEVKDSIKNYLSYDMEAYKAKEITSAAAVQYLNDKYPAPDKRPNEALSTDGENIILPDGGTEQR